MLRRLYQCSYGFRTRKRLIQVLIAIPAFILGLVGAYTEFHANPDIQEFFWSTILYRTFQMFVLELDPVGQPIDNISFWIAHWLAMLLAASVVIELLMHFSGQWITSLLIRSPGTNHFILCGLGKQGVKLVEKLLDAGEYVVVIESDPTHPDLDTYRNLGVVIFLGDPSSDIMLSKAGLKSAKHTLVLYNSDEVNYRIARSVHEQANRLRKSPLRCTIQIRDRSLLELLNQEELKTNSTDQFELEVFHADEVIARTMLREASWEALARTPQRMLVLTDFESAFEIETFIVRAIHDWIISSKESSEPLEITLIGRTATDIPPHIQQCYSEIADRVNLHAWNRGTNAWKALERDQEINLSPEAFDVAFVLSDREEHVLVGAASLQKLSDGNLPMIINVEQTNTNFRQFLPRDPMCPTELAKNIRIVSSEDSAYQIEMVTRPEIELLAQSCHQDYLFDHLNRGEIEKSAVMPWFQLEETYRSANRSLAGRLNTYLSGDFPHTQKLQKCYVTYRPVELFEFEQPQLDILAEKEHENWYEERYEKNWRFGPERDNERKLHPNMVPWSELSEADRDLDRNIIRRISQVFARMDIELSPAINSANSTNE